MPDRADLVDTFVNLAGWGDARRVTIAGDASNRRYERLTRATGETVILMDAPPEKGENTGSFLHMTKFLREIGLSAPKVRQQDISSGLLLLEDMGDDLFARVISADLSLERPLYEAATDVLIHLQRTPAPDLPLFDAKAMANATSLAFDWYQRGATGTVDTGARTAFFDAFLIALKPLDAQLSVPILRDYHAENLIWLPQRTDVARVGLLDYQDARRGHPAYDLVSLLQDARRDVSPDVALAMVDRYIEATGTDHGSFRAAYALLGAQRSFRILGIFARLSLVYGKPLYVDLIPRVWAHIETNLYHAALSEIWPYVNSALPAPTPGILRKLKDQCATFPLP